MVTSSHYYGAASCTSLPPLVLPSLTLLRIPPLLLMPSGSLYSIIGPLQGDKLSTSMECEAEATAPTQTVNAETLKGLKAHDGRKGQGLGDFRRWAPQGLGERKGLRLTPSFPTWVPERKMLPSTVTRNHVEGALEMFSASFREPVPLLCFSLSCLLNYAACPLRPGIEPTPCSNPGTQHDCNQQLPKNERPCSCSTSILLLSTGCKGTIFY